MTAQTANSVSTQQSWITVSAEVFNEALAPAFSGAMVAGPIGFTVGAATAATLYYVQKQHPELADSSIFQFFKHGVNIGAPFLTAVVTGQTCLAVETGVLNIDPEVLNQMSPLTAFMPGKLPPYEPTCIGVNALKSVLPYAASKLTTYLFDNLKVKTASNMIFTPFAGFYAYQLEQIMFNPAMKSFFN
ncbi:hypothetical protein D5018_12060 [Parashewanella curva]|uniref:Uncharacterized protein n=1 Tax=Parashewanella curva TaxID=2338552 RepID=A0A3L8PXA2_9GAMM|nr:hypothetical protein [Parashewanella curva]RLV59429.1 hypothetical protein D5018_12060 [Parashewanella curva]